MRISIRRIKEPQPNDEAARERAVADFTPIEARFVRMVGARRERVEYDFLLRLNAHLRLKEETK